MEDERIAVLLPFFDQISQSRRIEFLKKVDQAVSKGSLVIIGNANIPSYVKLENITVIHYTHSNSQADAFKRGFEIGVQNDAKKFITFEDYSIQNSTWFTPYLILSNVIESKRRPLFESFLIEFTNILSFRNVYNIFSMNRILSIDSVKLILQSELEGGNLAVKLTNIMNKNNIKITEIIRKSGKAENKVDIKNSLHVIKDSFSKSTFLYGLSGSLSYVLNLIIVYLSLSLGLLYPIAFFIGQETSIFSNFIVNRSVGLRSKRIPLSTFGKYNGIILVFVLLNIGIIWLLKYLLPSLTLSESFLIIIPTMLISIFSTITINKFIWGQNTVKVKA